MKYSEAVTPSVSYDNVGRGYGVVRRPDRRIAAAICDALGDAASVVNVGAGAGSYEPSDREVLAVEPSETMIAQRPPDAAPAIQAAAEALPLEDQSVDAAMAVLTMHHWDDVEQGLRELVRVARHRVVVVTMDVEMFPAQWIIRDYLPEVIAAHGAGFPTIARLLELLPRSTAAVLPVPRDCTDGFMGAFWGRPEAYLDPAIRAAGSPCHQIDPAIVARAIERLERDLASGAWDRRYEHLRRQSSLDIGLRLVTADLSARDTPRV